MVTPPDKLKRFDNVFTWKPKNSGNSSAKFTSEVGPNDKICWHVFLGEHAQSLNTIKTFHIEVIPRESMINQDFMVFGTITEAKYKIERNMEPRLILKNGCTSEMLAGNYSFPRLFSSLSAGYGYSFPVGISVSLKFTLVGLFKEDESSVLCSAPKMHMDFGLLLKDANFSDVVLVAEGDREFPAHKIILAARSPVFKAMLTADMKERNEGKIDLKDVNGKVLETMLEFLYTGCSKNMSDEENLCEHLLVIAEKYDIKDLKDAACVELCKTINRDNVGRRVLLAEKFRELKLRNQCMVYIKDHISEVTKSDNNIFVL